MKALFVLVLISCLQDDDCVYEKSARFDNQVDCEAAAGFMAVISPNIDEIVCEVQVSDE